MMSTAVTERPDPLILAAKIRSLLDRGRPGAARPLVAALRPSGATVELAAELDARLLAAEGRGAEAIAVLDAGLSQTGPSHSLHLARAEQRLLAGDLPGAAADAAEAILLDPRSPAAKALLGRALLQLGHAADALACLDEALAAMPRAVSTRLDLVVALDAVAEREWGDAVIAGGIALDPGNPSLHSAALLRCIRFGEFTAAVAMASVASKEGALDACGFGLMGHALSSLGRHAEAGQAYAEARKLAPDDPYVRHLVASAGYLEPGDRAPPDYVRVVFDDYAERFDQHLIHLGYRVPGLMRGVLARTAAVGPVLDLGCGTGLLALACSGAVQGDWVGVDLSPRMLDAARGKALYAELHEADILAYLACETRAFPLVLASDVLCYFGDLACLMQAVAPRITRGGQFAFTVERLAAGQESWRLGRMGRYAHSEAHVLAAGREAGLTLASMREDVLRLDGGAPVQGLVVVLERLA